MPGSRLLLDHFEKMLGVRLFGSYQEQVSNALLRQHGEPVTAFSVNATEQVAGS
jgi:hypothetical protein